MSNYCRFCLKNGIATENAPQFIGLLTDRPEYSELLLCAACAKSSAASDKRLLAGFRAIFITDKRGNLKAKYVRDETSLKMQAVAQALLAAR